MEIENETDKLLSNSDDNEEAADDMRFNELSKLTHTQHDTDDSSDTEDTEEGADKPIISSNDSDDEADSPNLSNSNTELNHKSLQHEYEKVKQEMPETVEIVKEINNTTFTPIKQKQKELEKHYEECQLNDTVNEPTITIENVADAEDVEEATATKTFVKVIATPDNEEIFNDEDIKLIKNISHKTSTTDSPNQSLDFFYSANDLFEYDQVVRRHESRTPDVESGYFEKSDSLYSKEEFEARSSSRQPSQYDQTISESLHNQLNRFDLLIDTIDQRNAMNIASNAEERGYWSTIFGQASEIETYDEMSQEKSNLFAYFC